jgi:hypothetical protein
MIEVSRCANCGCMGIINNKPCMFCDNTKKTHGFINWITREIKKDWLNYKVACYFAASILSGIFMKHFHYSDLEIITQLLCLAIILPGLFKDV